MMVSAAITLVFVAAVLVGVVAYQLFFGTRTIPADKKEQYAIAGITGSVLLSLVSLAVALATLGKVNTLVRR